MKYSVGWSNHVIEIDDAWNVLDVGSGHRPFERANTIVDLFPEDDNDRIGQKCVKDSRLICADACDMPFKDKSFDYILTTHLAEHIDNPEKFCKEIMRVGKRGYIETPSLIQEWFLGQPCHKWYVWIYKNTLYFKPKIKHVCISPTFLNIYNYGKTAEYASVPDEHILTLRNLFHQEWRYSNTNKKITYTIFDWEGSFNFKVLTKDEPFIFDEF